MPLSGQLTSYDFPHSAELTKSRHLRKDIRQIDISRAADRHARSQYRKATYRLRRELCCMALQLPLVIGTPAMLRLIRNLIRPYRASLAVVLAAMLVETLMSLAAPWPLKVVLDNVVGSGHLPEWLNGMLMSVLGG